jgi:uncharacterized protein (UPF0261 family)
MLNFGPPNTVPEKFKDRKYQHNPTVTLIRARGKHSTMGFSRRMEVCSMWNSTTTSMTRRLQNPL